MTRYVLIIFGLVIAIIALFMTSLAIGPADIGVIQSWRELFGPDGDVFAQIMREIRLPRALLAVIIGISLGASGAAMQGYLRNPLAEPGVLGISSAAALGAVIALQTGFALEGSVLNAAIGNGKIWAALRLPAAALLGAAMAAILVLLFGGARRSDRLILVGIGISAIAGALTSLALNLSPNPFAVYETMYWLMGSIADRSMLHVWIVLPFFVIGLILMLPLGRALDALSLGRDTAQSLGVNMTRLSLMLIISVTLLVGSTVAVAGAIGFVGLVVPHMLRPLIGAKPSPLLLASGLGGAVLILGADILVRVITPMGRDLQLGVLTALIGAPIFLHLVIKTTGR